jgi:hypothetical protein
MTSLLQGDHQSGLTLPKPPDSARPVGLQNNIRRRSQLVTGPYPTHNGRSRGQPVQTAKPDTSESNIPANWDVMTGQQTRGAQVSNTPFLSTFLQSTAGGTIVGGGPKQKKHKQTIHRSGGKPRSPVASGPAASYGKSTEEMYDEIIHLKKVQCSDEGATYLCAYEGPKLHMFVHLLPLFISSDNVIFSLAYPTSTALLHFTCTHTWRY